MFKKLELMQLQGQARRMLYFAFISMPIRGETKFERLG